MASVLDLPAPVVNTPVVSAAASPIVETSAAPAAATNTVNQSGNWAVNLRAISNSWPGLTVKTLYKYGGSDTATFNDSTSIVLEAVIDMADAISTRTTKPIECNWTVKPFKSSMYTCWDALDCTTSNHAGWKFTTSGTVYNKWCEYEYRVPKPLSVSDQLREIMLSRRSPAILVPDRSVDAMNQGIREVRAKQTLRTMIGDQRYQDFLRKGFVSVRNPKSGRVYQIFPGHGFTHVYEDGKLIERLCVVLKGDFPPTDQLIARYLIAINNEERLWQLANKHGTPNKAVSEELPDLRPLPIIFAEIKEAFEKGQTKVLKRQRSLQQLRKLAG